VVTEQLSIFDVGDQRPETQSYGIGRCWSCNRDPQDSWNLDRKVVHEIGLCDPCYREIVVPDIEGRDVPDGTPEEEGPASGA
jgi:hypothetical protein